MKKIEMILWLMIFTVVMIALGPSAYRQLTMDRRPPIASFGTTLSLGDPVRGDIATIRYFRTKVRSDCSVCAYRAAYDARGVLYDLPNACHPGAKANQEYADIGIDVSELGNGNFVLSTRLEYDCPGDLTFHYPTMLTPFRIERVK